MSFRSPVGSKTQIYSVLHEAMDDILSCGAAEQPSEAGGIIPYYTAGD